MTGRGAYALRLVHDAAAPALSGVRRCLRPGHRADRPGRSARFSRSVGGRASDRAVGERARARPPLGTSAGPPKDRRLGTGRGPAAAPNAGSPAAGLATPGYVAAGHGYGARGAG